MKHVSQRTIAQACKVNQKTVSRVFVEPDAVAPATRELVLATARRLGYMPVGNDRKRSAGQVVVLLEDPVAWRSPLHPHALRGISQQLTASGVALVHAIFPESAFRDARALLALTRRFHADALLCNYHGTLPEGLDAHLDHLGLPALWINRPRDTDGVRPDDLAAGVMATEQLLKKGHRNIAYVQYRWGNRPAAEDHCSVVDRRAGYRLTMRQAGLEPQVIDVNPLIRDPLGRQRQLQRMLKGPSSPTALLGYSTTAFTFLPAIAQLGIQVPEDLSLASIGADHSADDGADYSGSLFSWEQLGVVTATCIQKRLKKPAVGIPSVVIPPTWHQGATIAPYASK